MFGIGGGEMVVILILLLLAVGPERMPGFMKAVGRGMREFRKATREIRSTVGIDELLRDEDFRDPLGMNKPVKPKPPAPSAASQGSGATPAKPTAPAGRENGLTEDELRAEAPAEGVDVAWARVTAKRAAASGGSEGG
jgi:TatA/E family protein of Tat protein translocase